MTHSIANAAYSRPPVFIEDDDESGLKKIGKCIPKINMSKIVLVAGVAFAVIALGGLQTANAGLAKYVQCKSFCDAGAVTLVLKLACYALCLPALAIPD